LNLSGTVAGGSFGVAVDPAGSIGYSVGGSRIDVLNLSNFTKTDSLNIGDTIGNGNIFVPQGVGRLSISKDGTILAVITDNGFAVVQTQSVRFVTFAIRISHARMKFHEEQGPGHDSFRVAGDFTLDTHSNGIDPLTENVTLEIGSLALTIPGGSFTQTGPHFNFQGTIDGVAVSFSLRPHGPSRFRFNAEGDGADLSVTSVPLTVGLIIGDDRGSIKLNEGEAELRSEKPRTRGGE